MTDSYKHKGLRKKLVEKLKEKGIKDPLVLTAIEKTPRHYFVQKYTAEIAYEDRALQIGAGQTISQPYTVAYQSELLQIKPKDKVLEVGTGSGYQAAILFEMGALVYTIERQKALYEHTSKLLPQLGYKPVFFLGDGTKGLPEHTPFDKIIVTAGARTAPETLLKQLVIGGIMVIPVGDEKRQKMITILRVGENDYEKIVLDDFSFVPLIVNDQS